MEFNLPSRCMLCFVLFLFQVPVYLGGTNLILNPGAQSDPNSLPNWTPGGSFTAWPGGDNGHDSTRSFRSSDTVGKNVKQWMTQGIDLTNQSQLSALYYFGGWTKYYNTSENAYATHWVDFYSKSNQLVMTVYTVNSTVSLTWKYYNTTICVPADITKVYVNVGGIQFGVKYIDAISDDMEFYFISTNCEPVPQPVPSPHHQPVPQPVPPPLNHYPVPQPVPPPLNPYPVQQPVPSPPIPNPVPKPYQEVPVPIPLQPCTTNIESSQYCSSFQDLDSPLTIPQNVTLTYFGNLNLPPDIQLTVYGQLNIYGNLSLGSNLLINQITKPIIVSHCVTINGSLEIHLNTPQTSPFLLFNSSCVNGEFNNIVCTIGNCVQEPPKQGQVNGQYFLYFNFDSNTDCSNNDFHIGSLSSLQSWVVIGASVFAFVFIIVAIVVIVVQIPQFHKKVFPFAPTQ